jgi:Ni/Co efflux regulator RcnB
MRSTRIGVRLTMFALLAALGSGAALAERGGRPDGHDRRDDRRDEDRQRHDDRYDDRRGGPRSSYRDDYWHERDPRFHDDFRARVDVYYDREFQRGHCPPGLRKKGHGCMPPGHARQWERGRPLPRNVVYTPLPPALLVQLPPPPMHHEYVRVASDVLLIATGTAMVVDAIEDIGQRR